MSDHSAAPASPTRHYRFGDFLLDMSRNELLRDGEPVMLSQKAFDLLAVLVENRDRVMTKDELITAVWRDAFVSEDSLSQSIFMLRRTLADDPGAPRFIATSHRRGYRFIAEVAEMVPGAEETSRPPAAIAPAVAPAVAAPSLIAASPPSATVTAPPTRLRWRSLAVPAAIVLTAAATWIAARALYTPRTGPANGPLRAVQSAPPGTTFISGGVFSPDSRMLAFVARDERTGVTHVWVRDLSTGEDRALAETEGAEEPFWSPDSRQLAFSSNGKLQIVELDGGPARTIADVGFGLRPGGGSWSRDGTVFFATRRTGLHVVNASGGGLRAITTLNAASKESAHRLPRFLPDGRHFLYYIVSADPDRAGTYVASIDGGHSTRVVDGIQATYAAGHVIYVKEGALFSQPFDPDRLRVTGAPVPLATGVSEARAVSATERNVVAFVENVSAGKLAWFNRAGDRLDEIDSSAPLANPMLMGPKQVIGANNDLRGVQGVWIGDLDRRVFTRLTSRGIAPMPSPDNRKVVFTSDHAGGIRDLYVLDLHSGSEQLLLGSRENKLPTDWTRDGRFIVFGSSNESTKQDVWMLPMEGDRKPVPLVSSPFNEIQARVSPDGRWFAYASDETGRWEVYLQSFPATGNKQLVSVGGGGQPQWRADGKELFYLALDRTLMSVSLTGGAVPQIGHPKPLFQMPIADVVGWRNRFAPDAEGRNFLVSSVETTERPEIVLLIDALR